MFVLSLSEKGSEKLVGTRGVDGKVDEGLDDPTLLAEKSAPFISNREQSGLPTLPLSRSSSLLLLLRPAEPLANKDNDQHSILPFTS